MRRPPHCLKMNFSILLGQLRLIRQGNLNKGRRRKKPSEVRAEEQRQCNPKAVSILPGHAWSFLDVLPSQATITSEYPSPRCLFTSFLGARFLSPSSLAAVRVHPLNPFWIQPLRLGPLPSLFKSCFQFLFDSCRLLSLALPLAVGRIRKPQRLTAVCKEGLVGRQKQNGLPSHSVAAQKVFLFRLRGASSAHFSSALDDDTPLACGACAVLVSGRFAQTCRHSPSLRLRPSSPALLSKSAKPLAFEPLYVWGREPFERSLFFASCPLCVERGGDIQQRKLKDPLDFPLHVPRISPTLQLPRSSARAAGRVSVSGVGTGRAAGETLALGHLHEQRSRRRCCRRPQARPCSYPPLR